MSNTFLTQKEFFGKFKFKNLKILPQICFFAQKFFWEKGNGLFVNFFKEGRLFKVKDSLYWFYIQPRGNDCFLQQLWHTVI